MSRLCAALLLVVACAGPSAAVLSATTTTSIAVPQLASSTTPAPVECPPPPYFAGILPSRAAEDPVTPSRVEFDRFTSLAGTSSAIWTDADGETVMALVRGTLPPEQFTGEREIVKVHGVDAVLAPVADDHWVVAWYETEDRCDLYTLVFYPPVDVLEARAVVAGLERAGD